LTEELQTRLQTNVRFDYRTLYAPLARVPRMVFCPAELDFERAGRDGISWVGPYLDHERKEPEFPWAALPQERPIAYCALGTQSSRHANTVQVLQTVVDVFSARNDYFLVMACSTHQQAALRNVPAHVLLVDRAPQLALLRRARLALTHAGFNSLKECAALGVPMVALPLGLDQPRNAALVQLRRLGAALDVDTLTAAQLDAAVSTVSNSAPVKAACARMKAISESYDRAPLALRFIAGLLRGESQRQPSSRRDRGASCTSTI
jgi:UDP:flavonoid glycosyltransferase YjiC (YdhE family)